METVAAAVDGTVPGAVAVGMVSAWVGAVDAAWVGAGAWGLSAQPASRQASSKIAKMRFISQTSLKNFLRLLYHILSKKGSSRQKFTESSVGCVQYYSCIGGENVVVYGCCTCEIYR